MKPNNIEILEEGVLKVVKNGELVAVVHNDMVKRSQEFYLCRKMGVEEIKSLLISINSNDKENI